MKLALSLILLASLSSVARADCPVDKIEAALASSVDGLKRLDRDVTDVQSTEGGVW